MFVWQQVFGSSNVDAVSYDEEKKECAVRFKKGGDIYIYGEVTAEEYNELVHSQSKGRFVQIYLRRTKPSRRASEAETADQQAGYTDPSGPPTQGPGN